MEKDCREKIVEWVFWRPVTEFFFFFLPNVKHLFSYNDDVYDTIIIIASLCYVLIIILKYTVI